MLCMLTYILKSCKLRMFTLGLGWRGAGSYDHSLSVTRNINLPDSLLSRMDLLFIVLDNMTAERDRLVAATPPPSPPASPSLQWGLWCHPWRHLRHVASFAERLVAPLKYQSWSPPGGGGGGLGAGPSGRHPVSGGWTPALVRAQ